MTTSQNIKHALAERGLAPNKRLGQNFLIHKHTAARIVELAGIGRDDTVVELGVGLGMLTRFIAARARRVYGIEIDAGIVRWLREQKDLPENLTLIHQDLLKTDFRELAARCGGRLKIIANLPYSISNPLLFKLLDNQEIMAWAVLMLQKEVGMRIAAGPGNKDYGVLSVLLGAGASVQTLMQVGPGQFYPRPKVDSLVVHISFDPPPERIRLLSARDQEILRHLVKGAFQKRRKTLLNALSSASIPGLDKDAAERLLQEAGIPGSVRAERLTVEDFVNLARCWTEIIVSDHRHQILPRSGHPA